MSTLWYHPPPQRNVVTVTVQSTPAQAARPGLTSAGLLTLLLGAALNVIDFFIVNVALPTIDADLQASSATLEMVVAGYGFEHGAHDTHTATPSILLPGTADT